MDSVKNPSLLWNGVQCMLMGSQSVNLRMGLLGPDLRVSLKTIWQCRSMMRRSTENIVLDAAITKTIKDFHQFTFSVKPCAQERARVSRWGGVYTPTKSVKSKTELQDQLKHQWLRRPIMGPIMIEIVFRFQKPKSTRRKYCSVKPDLDNLMKLLCDAFNKRLWHDDAQIVSASVHKEYGTEGIELNVFELAG